jgi:hypothetical protein
MNIGVAAVSSTGGNERKCQTGKRDPHLQALLFKNFISQWTPLL